ncbi:MAG: O-antigen ligase family protein [Proteobacteria bacterium]|nr:O-antigen ligase family protein [Pseudomonadota bacterium]
MTLFQRFIVPLSVTAMILPVFSGYLVTFLMLVFFLASKYLTPKEGLNRSIGGSVHNSSTVSSEYGLWSHYLYYFFALLAVTLFLPLALDFEHQTWSNLKKALEYFAHSLIKYGFLWWFMTAYFNADLKSSQRTIEYLCKSVGIISFLHFAYCLAQRSYGIDWVHGFSATLPPNRFAYGVYRVSGFTSHPLTIGYQLCLIVVLANFLMVDKRLSLFSRRIAGTGLIFSLLTILISGSRGPMLVSAIIAIVQNIRFLLRHKGVVAISGVIFLVVVGKFTNIISRFSEIGALSQSGDSRTTDWTVYLTAFKSHLLFGLGPVNFSEAISAYYAQLNADAKIGLAHNFYLQIGAELGLVGLLAFAIWICNWFRHAKLMRKRHEKCAMYSILGVMIISGITQSALKDSEVLYTLIAVTHWVLISSYRLESGK